MNSIIERLADLSPKAKRAVLAQLLEKKLQRALLGGDSLARNVVELDAEVRLDPSIDAAAPPVDFGDEPRHIFLTGATGFLGAFLLAELLQQRRADIHYLVRAASLEEGYQRIRQTLEFYSLWDDTFASRIVPVPGDLAEPGLGLSRESARRLATTIDVIYHSGAQVNWIYPYDRLKAANVLGTEAILRLASEARLKPVHFVSTLGVFPLIGGSGPRAVRETDTLDHDGVLYGGYLQSKWVAEKLVMIARSRGLPVSIYRPGMITGHSETGAWNTGDVTSRMIKSWIELGAAPTLEFDTTDMTPVDYVSRAIVRLSARSDSLGKAFHLANPRRIHLSALVDWMRSFGYQLRQIPYKAWMAEVLSRAGLSREDVIASLVPLFSLSIAGEAPRMLSTLPEFDCENTHAGLAGSSIRCTPVDARVLETYFSFFIRRGFLSPPLSGAGVFRSSVCRHD